MTEERSTQGRTKQLQQLKELGDIEAEMMQAGVPVTFEKTGGDDLRRFGYAIRLEAEGLKDAVATARRMRRALCQE